jgi:hypothetical protein
MKSPTLWEGYNMVTFNKQTIDMLISCLIANWKRKEKKEGIFSCNIPILSEKNHQISTQKKVVT